MSIPDFAMPDYLACIKNHLEAQSYLSTRTIKIRALTSGDDDIADGDPNLHKTNIITITGIPGFGQHTGILMNPRFEIRSWGSNGYEAMLGWRLAHSALCPPPGDASRHSSFTYNGCHIYDVAIVATPLTLIDTTGWESRSAFYAAKVREVPVT